MNEVLETNIFHHDNFKVNLQYFIIIILPGLHMIL